MADNPKRFEMIVDPITLWKAIHGGDPAPDVIRLTAAVAIYIPARQAMRINPVQALRME